MGDQEGMQLRALAAAVRERRLSAHELVAESLRRIEARDPDLGAVVALRADEALEDARGLDAAIAGGAEAGVLAGLPLLVKDMTDVAGMRTTFGSQVFATAPEARSDAMVVARLRAAGAIVVGKTNLPEFAAEGYTANLLFGPTRNPWNRARTCGGSSGGSAVAIAAGMAAIATATDGGGSIRIPASYCGLYGLKPTNGVIGRDPVPDWIDYSTDGPLAMRADDLRLLLNVLAGPTPGDPTTQPVRPRSDTPSLGAVFALERWEDIGPLPPEAGRPFEAALERFAEVFGVVPRRLTPEEIVGDRKPEEEWVAVCASEHAHLFGRSWIDEHAPELTPSARSFLELGSRVSLEVYLAARRHRFEYVRTLDELLGADGVVLSPVMAADAIPAEGPADGRGSDPMLYVTTMQNITGHPALSLPAGAFPSAVRFGLQVTAPRFRDDLLLWIADRWEEAEGPAPSPPGYGPFGV
jgi:Asp-tRNA(Asn)/Glu-tRNA(Gln) amidotransferase A subunit family amidase